MVFIAVDKGTKKIGVYDCSPQFLERGKDKVERAIDAYRLFFKDENFDLKNYCITETL
jgi:ubiquinone/menaquinone biosynthesis C-methylase UbiE